MTTCELSLSSLTSLHRLNLPKDLRKKLKALPEFSLDVAREETSRDGTIKRAYRVGPHAIESVLMRYDRGNTACISSQAGCAMGCVFCATGQMGFQTQLSGLEIFEQAARFDSLLKQQDDRLHRVVFMGMGEPLLNFNAVSEAIERLQTDLRIGARRITVSTVGVVPAIPKFAKEHPNVNLAISLHAANDQERSKLLPANARYGGLHTLMTASYDYWILTKRQLTFEYALSQDDDVHRKAMDLIALFHRYKLSGSPSHVNVIPLNPTPFYSGTGASSSNLNTFIDLLAENGISATIRLRRGIDINAGCGQLATKVLQQQ